MNGIRPQRLGRAAAERLLDGAPAGGRPGGDPLASVLAAAAAPPRAAEYAGEDAAVTAFLAEHLVPVSHSGRGQMIKSPLAKLLTIKIGAAALALSAGGAALAASTGAFTANSGHAHVAANVSARAGAHVSTHASGPARHAGPNGKAPITVRVLPATETGQVCRDLAVQVAGSGHIAAGALTQAGLRNALESPVVARVVSSREFAALVATAKGRANVADYCGLILHLPKLPWPAGLVKLPISVLSGIPAGIVAKISASALAGVPASGLSHLPVVFLTRLSVSAQAALPAGVLARLPVGTLTRLLPRLPTGTLCALLPRLPGGTLTGLLSGLPPETLTGILAKLPAGSLTSVLGRVPAGSLTSVLGRVPHGSLGGILGKLPAGSPGHVLPNLPAPARSALPRSLSPKLPGSL